MDKNKMIADVIVVGGGPAGISAAIWCGELGLETIILEQSPHLGGQLRLTRNPITNYPGRHAADGREMLGYFESSLAQFDITTRLSSRVSGISAGERLVTLETGEKLAAKALIFATGVRRRRLGIDGEDRFEGSGIMSSGIGDRALAVGRRVVIVGGGDAALENALILRSEATEISIIHRRGQFSGRRGFVDAVMVDRKINKIFESRIDRIIGDKHIEAVEITNVQTRETRLLTVDLLLIRIGVVPNTEVLRGEIGLDERGYILANARCETSSAGVFAIGDAANPVSPTISTAAGTGATAAKAAHAFINR